MTTDSHHFVVSGIRVEVVRKDIKNLHLGVYPPNGRVRVAAPLILSDEAVRLSIIDKLSWIKRQRTKFAEQPRQSRREMVSGESHYFLGRRYRLRVIEQSGTTRITLKGSSVINLYVRPGASADKREEALNHWYRGQLKAVVQSLLQKWERKLGVQVSCYGIKRMKTKWGSCNTDARRVWFNLELVKKPIPCIEYLVVHELCHLLERKHGDGFIQILEKAMPNWRQRRKILNSAPLGHEDWDY